MNEFEDIANDVLRENGFSYTAHAEYGKFEFPEKTYKSMILPAGEYLRCKDLFSAAVKDIIGGALCIRRCALKRVRKFGSVKKAKKFLREKLDKDTYDIITKNDKEVVVKFKLVEIVQEIKQKITS